jgi:hypothetical protein
MSTPALIPDEQQKLAEVSSEVSGVVAQAHAITVETPAQAEEATGILVTIKSTKARSERARKYLIELPTLQITRLNAVFKETTEPLAEADRIVRGKVLAFRQEQERERADEQARLDAQRKAAEEVAAAERRRAEEEAARAEREAIEAERKRQEQSGKRRRELAAMSDDELLAVLHEHESDPFPKAVAETARVRAEFKSRTEAIEAQQRAEDARREAEEATQASIAAQSAPAPRAAAPAPLAADSGSAAVRREWKATIVDVYRLPREYLTADTKAINAAVREGVREIPGVRIEQVSGLSVRAR